MRCNRFVWYFTYVEINKKIEGLENEEIKDALSSEYADTKKFLLERKDVLTEEEIKWNEEGFKRLEKDD